MVTKVTYVGEGFTRKPPKYERFIRPMVRVHPTKISTLTDQHCDINGTSCYIATRAAAICPCAEGREVSHDLFRLLLSRLYGSSRPMWHTQRLVLIQSPREEQLFTHVEYTTPSSLPSWRPLFVCPSLVSRRTRSLPCIHSWESSPREPLLKWACPNVLIREWREKFSTWIHLVGARLRIEYGIEEDTVSSVFAVLYLHSSPTQTSFSQHGKVRLLWSSVVSSFSCC